MHRGSCLCGGVRFTIAVALPPPDACHCVQCRKQTGHYLVSSDVPKAALAFEANATLRWYASSEKIRRGFCGDCGSTLFWEPLHRDWIGVALGAIDGATGTRMHMHIHVAEKGDYYGLDDGLPQHAH
jgi:hypothetical protein